MKTSDFFKKFMSLYLWGHLLAMAVVVVLLCVGLKFGLEWYTRHGQGIRVPKIEGMYYSKARLQLENLGLVIQVSDSGYNKRLPADCILAQMPGAGTYVKEGHTIYITVNSPSSPTFAIPDIVDNSSFREAEAKLMAMGFKLLPPKRIVGEKDWVYGILCRGRRVTTGDQVSVESPLTLIIGNGTYDDEVEDISYTEPEYQSEEAMPNYDDVVSPVEPATTGNADDYGDY